MPSRIAKIREKKLWNTKRQKTMSTDFTSPAGNTHPAHPSHTLIHISIFSNMNSFSKRFSDHRPSCNAVGAGFSSCLVHFLQVWEQRSDRAVHFSFITLYTTQHHHQLYPLNPDRAVTKALRPHTVYLFIGPGCAHSISGAALISFYYIFRAEYGARSMQLSHAGRLH